MSAKPTDPSRGAARSGAASYTFETIDGFRCYAPARACGEADYPSAGFDVSRAVEERSFWCRSRNRLIRMLFHRFVGRSRHARVLEIGCGIGGILSELARMPNLTLIGSEIYLHGLRYARARLPQVDFIQLDATTMPFVSEFDVIVAFDVFEHIDADVIAMERVREALVPGGLLMVSVPQYPWLWSRLDELVHHKRRYTRAELTDRLGATGFDILYLTSFVAALFPLMLLSRFRSKHARAVGSEGEQFQAEVSFPPALNALFDRVMRVDEMAIRAGIPLPFGGSLVAVARKTRT